jgi:hypothetical protein
MEQRETNLLHPIMSSTKLDKAPEHTGLTYLRHEDGKYTYAVFSEMNVDELETWYTFIRKEGNAEPLESLKRIIDGIRWDDAPDDVSVFSLDTKGVSEKTAKEMCMIDLDHYFFHSKFDGKMKRVPVEDHSSSRRTAISLHDQVGGNNIADFLSDEDLENCELCDPSENPSSEEDEESCYSYSSEEETSTATKINEDDLPPVLKSSLATTNP